ncbi:unknown [Amedibacillus dolichus CAG:375]|uniref:Uncharacterized protein n=1 Tax=Amedibacillus dolichus CAG:375 TaxID=1263076 RepID=R7G7A8_9FIRM|nr:hypothetical protein [Amedibacillus dolichus]CDE23035.1 unknown [Amedibacillus dolichus CAG:375]
MQSNYVFGFQKVIDGIKNFENEMYEEQKRLFKKVPTDSIDFVDFLNNQKTTFDRLMEIPDYILLMQRLQFHCTFFLHKQRDEGVKIDGYMDDMMWEDLGAIDALTEIKQCIDATEKAAMAKEYHLVQYLENLFQNLLKDIELSTIKNDDLDKFICLYTKIMKNCSNNNFEFGRVEVMKHYKENLSRS